MNFKVSVIICTVARLHTIRYCIESLKKQSEKEFEVIIVDGRVDDGLEKLCRLYTKHLAIKRVKINKRNLAYSRNQGILNMSSRIAAFIDDDAQADRKWVENILKVFEANPKVVGIGGKILSASDRYLSNFAERLFDYGSVEKKLKTITGVNMSLHIGRIRKLKLYKRKKIFNEKYVFAGEETDACLYVNSCGGNLLYSPKIVVRHFFETNVIKFIKKHFGYGIGDSRIVLSSGYGDLFPEGVFLTKGKRDVGGSLLVFNLVVAIIKKSLLFTRRYGIVWAPAITVRETVYTLGFYYHLLKRVNT